MTIEQLNDNLKSFSPYERGVFFAQMLLNDNLNIFDMDLSDIITREDAEDFFYACSEDLGIIDGIDTEYRLYHVLSKRNNLNSINRLATLCVTAVRNDREICKLGKNLGLYHEIIVALPPYPEEKDCKNISEFIRNLKID